MLHSSNDFVVLVVNYLFLFFFFFASEENDERQKFGLKISHLKQSSVEVNSGGYLSLVFTTT